MEIDKIWVVCAYCGTANLFTSINCGKCGGKLEIGLRIKFEKKEEEILDNDMTERIRYALDLPIVEKRSYDDFDSHVLKRKMTAENAVKELIQPSFPFRKIFLIIASLFIVFVLSTLPFSFAEIQNADYKLLGSLLIALIPMLVIVMVVRALKKLA